MRRARLTIVFTGSSTEPTMTGPPGTRSGSSTCPNCRTCWAPGRYAASWSTCSSAWTSNTRPRLPANRGRPSTHARSCTTSGRQAVDTAAHAGRSNAAPTSGHDAWCDCHGGGVALRGFGYLRELLRRPRQPVAALDLAGAGTGIALQSGLGDLLDKQALNT